MRRRWYVRHLLTPSTPPSASSLPLTPPATSSLPLPLPPPPHSLYPSLHLLTPSKSSLHLPTPSTSTLPLRLPLPPPPHSLYPPTCTTVGRGRFGVRVSEGRTGGGWGVTHSRSPLGRCRHPARAISVLRCGRPRASPHPGSAFKVSGPSTQPTS